jgi:hypothetical protein
MILHTHFYLSLLTTVVCWYDIIIRYFDTVHALLSLFTYYCSLLVRHYYTVF